MNSAIVQKLKGKGQKLRGKFKKHTGDEVGGVIDQIRGTANEVVADIKTQTDTDFSKEKEQL